MRDSLVRSFSQEIYGSTWIRYWISSYCVVRVVNLSTSSSNCFLFSFCVLLFCLGFGVLFFFVCLEEEGGGGGGAVSRFKH